VSAAVNAREEAEIVCQRCAVVFRVPVPHNQALPGYCGEDCRTEARRRRERERKRTLSPARQLRVRERCHAWAQEHRNVKKPNPWLAGPPPFERYLPGGFMTVEMSPPPTRAIRMQDTRGLHGALTAILDRGHEQHTPNFALVPDRLAWGVYWWREEGLRFAGRTINGALWDRPTAFRFGPLWRIKAPTIAKRGRQRVRVDAITPVCSRAYGSTVYRSTPTSDVMHSMLAAQFAHRLGLSYLAKQDLVRVEIVSSKTDPAPVNAGEHLGRIVGWTGYAELEVNAPALWLLRVAERVGLGGRTSLGFGRIRVTPC
jgi:CRISPR-associated endoribonuclease Cas6